MEYPIFKEKPVIIAGDAIMDLSRNVVARATTWKDGKIVAWDDQAGVFIAENTGGNWDGQQVHSAGCTCGFCNDRVPASK